MTLITLNDINYCNEVYDLFDMWGFVLVEFVNKLHAAYENGFIKTSGVRRET